MSKILIIEDDRSASRLMEYAFEHEGYEVVVAANGVEGLAKALQDEPDLIILDVMLPGIDGFEVCQRLRSEERTLNLPILMLSAKGQEADRLAGEKVGATEYLLKPIDPDDLIARVSNFLTPATA